MDITIERVGLGIKMRSIFVVVAISLFWSASVKAGGRWIDANKEACPDICKADKGENGGAPGRGEAVVSCQILVASRANSFRGST